MFKYIFIDLKNQELRYHKNTHQRFEKYIFNYIFGIDNFRYIQYDTDDKQDEREATHTCKQNITNTFHNHLFLRIRTAYIGFIMKLKNIPRMR